MITEVPDEKFKKLILAWQGIDLLTLLASQCVKWGGFKFSKTFGTPAQREPDHSPEKSQ